MGHGIALEFALHGYDVCLHSRSQASVENGLAKVRDSLARMAGLGVVSPEEASSALSRLRPNTLLKKAVRDADVVVESVYEDLELKQQVFQLLDEHCPEHAILASNTSTLMPGRLVSRTRRPDRVLVAHYINPPYLVPLVEIVPGAETSDATVDTMRRLLAGIGKRPIVLQREVPGFVASRLQAALLREALWLVENRVAGPQDVDAAIKDSLGRRWAVAGVFEVLELAGWDLLLAIASELFPHLASTQEAPEPLKERVALGEVGVKAGKGFYDWTPESAEALRQRIAEALVRIERWAPDPSEADALDSG